MVLVIVIKSEYYNTFIDGFAYNLIVKVLWIRLFSI